MSIQKRVESPAFIDIYRKGTLLGVLLPAIYFTTSNIGFGEIRNFIFLMWPIFFLNFNQVDFSLEYWSIPEALLYGWPLLILAVLAFKNYGAIKRKENTVYQMCFYSWVIGLMQMYLYLINTAPYGTNTLILPLPLIVLLLLNVPITIAFFGKLVND